VLVKQDEEVAKKVIENTKCATKKPDAPTKKLLLQQEAADEQVHEWQESAEDEGMLLDMTKSSDINIEHCTDDSEAADEDADDSEADDADDSDEDEKPHAALIQGLKSLKNAIRHHRKLKAHSKK